jgi:hypothetical protein
MASYFRLRHPNSIIRLQRAQSDQDRSPALDDK